MVDEKKAIEMRAERTRETDGSAVKREHMQREQKNRAKGDRDSGIKNKQRVGSQRFIERKIGRVWECNERIPTDIRNKPISSADQI